MDLHKKTGTPPDSGEFLTSSRHLQPHKSLGRQAFHQLQTLSPQPV